VEGTLYEFVPEPRPVKPPMPEVYPVFIYILVDPRNEVVRYVGRSWQPNDRYWQHYTEAKRALPKDQWVRELREAGLSFRMFIVEEATNLTASKRERHWTGHYRSLGAPLLNGDHRLA
jgi:hypothetical protein